MVPAAWGRPGRGLRGVSRTLSGSPRFPSSGRGAALGLGRLQPVGLGLRPGGPACTVQSRAGRTAVGGDCLETKPLKRRERGAGGGGCEPRRGRAGAPRAGCGGPRAGAALTGPCGGWGSLRAMGKPRELRAGGGRRLGSDSDRLMAGLSGLAPMEQVLGAGRAEEDSGGARGPEPW